MCRLLQSATNSWVKQFAVFYACKAFPAHGIQWNHYWQTIISFQHFVSFFIEMDEPWHVLIGDIKKTQMAGAWCGATIMMSMKTKLVDDLCVNFCLLPKTFSFLLANKMEIFMAVCSAFTASQIQCSNPADLMKRKEKHTTSTNVASQNRRATDRINIYVTKCTTMPIPTDERTNVLELMHCIVCRVTTWPVIQCSGGWCGLSQQRENVYLMPFTAARCFTLNQTKSEVLFNSFHITVRSVRYM